MIGCPDCELLRAIVNDASDDDTAVRKLCLPILGNLETNGDSFGVPSIVKVVEATIAKLRNSGK